MKIILLLIILLIVSFLSVAVSKTPKSSNDVVINYLDALVKSPKTEDKQRVKEHFELLFADFKKGANEEIIRKTYADSFYFNDTFKATNDIDELVPYMIETAKNVESTTVEILDIAKSETDYYIRWVMDMKFKVKRRDVHSKSTGVTQIRFNDEGKIVFHHDYWDSADGFYQHLPYVGFFVRKAKSMLE